MTEYRIKFSDYSFIDEEGTFTGQLDHKLYGKKNNIVAYITLEDGRKVIAVAYKDSNYQGLKDIEVDSFVEVTFSESKSGMMRLSGISVIE